MTKLIYDFAEGDASQKALLGGKGANLSEMMKLGIPVPPGFTITTQTCNQYLELGKKFTDELWDETKAHIISLEKQTNKTFGGADPLLVSVRSGAPVSMPGMMDTILNLGLNDQTVEALAKKTNNPRFAYDSYRRFIQMFANVVLEIEHHHFEQILRDIKSQKGVREDTDLDAEDWREVALLYKKLVQDFKNIEFPQDPMHQLKYAIEAVFSSWLNPRAIKYRQIYNISDSMGTAVNVQAMVFGNTGERSGTGVLFTRNPSTGTKELFGEFLLNAQGEDVVAGIRTPRSINELQNTMPQVHDQILHLTQKLEAHFHDMQDIEFTIEDERLYVLQTRSGKRSAAASIKIAVDMERENVLDKEEALLRIDPHGLDQLLHPRIADDQVKDVLTTGLPASPGAAVGQVVFSSARAEVMADGGKSVILVRHETSPEDINGMNVAKGILTACGGMTSHAAVVARGMGKPCVSGANDLTVDTENAVAHVGEVTFREGDWISLDGGTGEVMRGQCEMIPAEISTDFEVVLDWAQECSCLTVRTNADTPGDAQKARSFGAQGIGLCRTEHMFFEDDRIGAMREMILAQDEQQRKQALEKLLPFQQSDFEGIFEAMDGYPVNIRLLDPPLHEFLPHKDEDIQALAQRIGTEFETLKQHVLSLHEVNPMLGHRGCRLMVSYPEIARMQTRAIMQAACVMKRKGVVVLPEIMIPLVGVVEELKFLRSEMELVIQEVFATQDMTVPFKIGTMIEVPRACIVADEIAAVADYFSFGTNDLTQMTYGYSRDDVGKFLPEYLNKKFVQKDPFQVLDREGVGRMVSIAVGKGRKVKPQIKIGICGEHGGDPDSIEFFFQQNFDYISCSPYRVPVARIAAAQSYIRKKGN